jgi:hypothetical protein
MIKENRVSKYLLYAIGEIILVVVGILIALAVNNWNQEVKDHRSELDHLSRIHQDLVQDTENFKKSIENNNELREEIKELLVTLHGGVHDIEEVQKMTATFDKAMDQVFSPNDNTYRGMVSTGTLDLIQDQELKTALMDLYSEYDQKGALMSGISSWMLGIATAMDTQSDFFRFNGSVIDIYTEPEMLNENDFAFLNDSEDPGFKLLVRAISATAFNQKASNAYYLELIERCEIVMEQIEEELQENKR